MNGILEYGRHRPPAGYGRPEAGAYGRYGGQGSDQTLYHFLVIGQSNGNGTYDASAYPDPETLTVLPPSPRCWMFQSGLRCGRQPFTANINVADSGLTSLAPLKEVDLREWATSGTQGHGETPWTSFAYELCLRAGGRNVLVSVSNVDGSRYNNLKKTAGTTFATVPFANAVAEMRAGRAYAASRGWAYLVAAFLCVHGEDDASFNVTDYAANLAQWRLDLEAEARRVSGQRGTIPLFYCQQIDFNPAFQTDTSTCVSNQQWLAYQAARAVDPYRLILIGPKYQYQFTGDQVHLNPGCARWHGSQYAKAVYRTLWGGRVHRPLQPLRATRSGATITLDLEVPYPPLAIDVSLVTDTTSIPAGSGATGTSRLKAVSLAPSAGGSGYAVNDTVTLTGGTFTTAVVGTVTAVSSGAITSLSVTTAGSYSVLPSNPVSIGSTSGAGTGATITVTWGLESVTITAAGKNYPSGTTVSFGSGGGGSGAAGTVVLNAAAGVSSVTVSAAGTGYTSLPSVTFTSPAVVNGFSFSDDSGAAPAVTSVALHASGTQLTITLAGTPTGASQVLRYAWGTTTNASGSFVGTGRGNVRDSDPDVSRDGCKNYNWLPAFEMAVT